MGASRSAVLFTEFIYSPRTPRDQKQIAPPPSLKPQAFLRALTAAALPLGKGIVLDPFAGSGSTLAACQALGYDSSGIEADAKYVEMAFAAIPKLATLALESNGRADWTAADGSRRRDLDKPGSPQAFQSRICESKPLSYDVRLRLVR